MAGVAVCAVLALLPGCGGDSVRVDGFHVAAADRADCRAFLRTAPDEVAGQQRREVTGSAYAAAWGDPAIVLRCGVRLPEGYAVAPCITRDGIGWSIPLAQTDDLATAVDMTLAHRSLVVQVHVPRDYRPNGPMEVMADLAATVQRQTSARGKCV